MAGPFRFADRAVYHPASETLVCADLHLGRDATAAVELPLGERTRLPERFDALLDRFAPEEVVLAGDVLHAFDHVPDGVPATLEAIETSVANAGATLRYLRGNHDSMLAELVNGPVREWVRLDDGTVVCHGHEQPTVESDQFVIGHGHPAIEIEGVRRPCYLAGPAAVDDADVLALPAFTTLAPGVVVNRARRSDLQSPLFGPLRTFRPAVRDEDDDETLWFPPLGEIREHLR